MRTNWYCGSHLDDTSIALIVTFPKSGSVSEMPRKFDKVTKLHVIAYCFRVEQKRVTSQTLASWTKPLTVKLYS